MDNIRLDKKTSDSADVDLNLYNHNHETYKIKQRIARKVSTLRNFSQKSIS